MTLGGILEFFLGNTFSFVVFCSFGMSATLFIAKKNISNELMVKGGFWFTLGSTLTPAFNAFNTYSTDGHGLLDPDFHASFGEFCSKLSRDRSDANLSVAFFLLFMGLMSLLYLICALRTNITFVAIFFGLFMTFVLLVGAYWQYAVGHTAIALSLQKVSCDYSGIYMPSTTDGKLRIGRWRICIYGRYGRMVGGVHKRDARISPLTMVHRWIFFAQMLASVDFPFQLPVGDISHIIKGGSTRARQQEQFSA